MSEKINMKLNIHKKKTTVNSKLLRKYVMIFILSIWVWMGLVKSTLRSANFVIIDPIAF